MARIWRTATGTLTIAGRITTAVNSATIELSLKALKQNRTVKSFVGTGENTLCIWIWTVLIALLLWKRLHHLSKVERKTGLR